MSIACLGMMNDWWMMMMMRMMIRFNGCRCPCHIYSDEDNGVGDTLGARLEKERMKAAGQLRRYA